jgi:3-methyl-2-oxobutanoate hydroxymethyltransferase
MTHGRTTETTLYGGRPGRRVTVRDVQAAKERDERWAMLTSYDMLTATIFDEAGIPVLLVGDSAGNNVLGYETTVPVRVEELLPLTRAVVRATSRAMVVADLPFGSYQAAPAQALATAARFVQEAEAHAVKLEGGRAVLPQVELLVDTGVAVMGHIGLTPQRVHALGGYRVQGRGEAGDRLIEDALALQAAGVFALVLELVPAELAGRVSKELTIPTIGIGAGADCDAQVLVWTDMAGLTPPPGPRFVKRYADLRGVLTDAARAFAQDVRDGGYPLAEHSYD